MNVRDQQHGRTQCRLFKKTSRVRPGGWPFAFGCGVDERQEGKAEKQERCSLHSAPPRERPADRLHATAHCELPIRRGLSEEYRNRTEGNPGRPGGSTASLVDYVAQCMMRMPSTLSAWPVM